MRLKANLTLFAVAIIWGTGFITQGIAAKYQLAYLFNGFSFILASLILIPFFPHSKKKQPGAWKWMLVAGLVLFVATALQQVGIFYTKIANAGFLTSLYIIFTPFLLWIGFREKPHWMDILAVIGAVLGVFFLSTAGSFKVQPGDGLELIGAIFWGLHFVILGKFASKYEPISFAAGHFLVCGVLNLLMGLVIEDPGQLMLLPVVGAIAYRAVLSIGVGYTLQVWGQRHTPPTDAALILGMEAIFAVIAAWILLNQTLLPIQVVGCVIILVSVLFSQLKGVRHVIPA
ncbi:MAG: DMT family transporter [Desulfobacterales bacterium]|nr:DMT family transporter [Desulfobacterales bacterium]